jgi:hypothetical protein
LYFKNGLFDENSNISSSTLISNKLVDILGESNKELNDLEKSFLLKSLINFKKEFSQEQKIYLKNYLIEKIEKKSD